ncbi:OmpH family outer membrane protein [Sphingomonas sp. QA11]|uniref:OmpH family outer membrane protein n=1 Tax=Sphingomonas sp. QA11 TaxID=2950605 RepID=UPI00234A254B|nr:OmpH family outer membrane protein [Sphingomonas sp. QA11]WCM28885.1 OmpH family outer membrane protein [Sphingomonas sp. QA11]
MKTYKKVLLATALVVPGFVFGVAGAQAQTVAMLDPDAAMQNSKVWTTTWTTIDTTYKAQIDQAKARNEAINAEIQPLLKALDANGDGQLSQEEIQRARDSKRPELAQIEQKQTAGQAELGRILQPVTRARLYLQEQVGSKIADAVTSVVKTRKVGLIVKPEAVLMLGDATADITPAVSAEIDRTLTSVAVPPPVAWQPKPQQGQQAQGAPAAPAPAAPAGRPATTPPKGR